MISWPSSSEILCFCQKQKKTLNLYANKIFVFCFVFSLSLPWITTIIINIHQQSTTNIYHQPTNEQHLCDDHDWIWWNVVMCEYSVCICIDHLENFLFFLVGWLFWLLFHLSLCVFCVHMKFKYFCFEEKKYVKNQLKKIAKVNNVLIGQTNKEFWRRRRRKKQDKSFRFWKVFSF